MDAIETTTPTTTETTSTTAPAATAPTSTQTETVKESRPTSMRDAFARMETKSKGAATEPGQATTRPAETPPTAVDPTKPATPPTAPIPPDVHAKALDNARTKAVQARDQQWQEKTGWVLQLPPDRQEAAKALVSDFYNNPAMFIANIYGSLKDHPQWGPQLKALMGGNGNGNGHAAPAEDGMPQPDVEVIDPRTNQVVSMTYSDKQLAKRDAFLSKQYEQSLDKRLAPFEQERQAAKDRETQAESHRQTTAAVDQAEARILKILDGRKDLAEHVGTLMDQGMHWMDAALQVREQHLKPKQHQEAAQAAETEMRRKAAGNTVNGTGTTATPTKPKTREQLRQMMEAGAFTNKSA